MQGYLECNLSGEKCPYSIDVGFDVEKILQLEDQWGGAKQRIIKSIVSQMGESVKDSDEFKRLVFENNIPDLHWSWLTKAQSLNTPEYEWFYLVCDGCVQAVAIIYHPKESRVDQGRIFYIDYLASAYWNRYNSVYSKRFSSTGVMLIRFAIRYAVEVLNYRPGFSLHSLPSAEGFYKHLGLKEFGVDPDKENLKYFEAERSVAELLAVEG